MSALVHSVRTGSSSVASEVTTVKIQFTLNGTNHTLSTEEVEAALVGKEPERIFDYAIWVDGRWFPPKQAFVTPLGLRNYNVNSRTAFNHLRKLGFQSHDQRSEGPLPDAPGAGPSGVVNRDQRERALKLAVDLLTGTGASAADATRAADDLIEWLGAA